MSAAEQLEELGYRFGLAFARGLTVAPAPARKPIAATPRPRTKPGKRARRVVRADVSTLLSVPPFPTKEEAEAMATELVAGPAPFAMIGFDEPAAATVEVPPEESEARDALGSDIDDFLDDDAPEERADSFADSFRKEVEADAKKERAAEKEENRKRRGFVGAVDRIREEAP